MLSELLTSFRIAAASIALCVVLYGAAVLGAAALIAPESRAGSLITLDGRVVGSRLLAQAFTRPEYLWPRPSAVEYAADAAGGSNLSPAGPILRDRAAGRLVSLGATPDHPAPPEMALASGSGLDPHLTDAASLYQAARIAGARRVPVADISELLGQSARPVGPGDPARIVNVLLVNIELDRRFPMPAGGQ